MPITSLTKIQLAKETVWGTAAASTDVLPVTAAPGFAVEYNAIKDQGRRGIASMDYALLQGGGGTVISADGPALPQSIGQLLYGIMGSWSAGAAVSTVYPHTFSLGSSVPSFTVEDANPIAPRKVSGSKVNSLTLAFNSADGILTQAVSLTGLLPVAGASTVISTPETAQPWIGIDATVSLAGTVVARVTSFTVKLSRAQDRVFATGSRDSIRIDEQPLEVTISLALDSGISAADDLARYLGSSGAFTQEAMVLTCTYGATTTLRSLVFTATSCNWGDGPASRDLGNGLYQTTLSGRALYNTTDSGPCKFVLSNTKATY